LVGFFRHFSSFATVATEGSTGLFEQCLSELQHNAHNTLFNP